LVVVNVKVPVRAAVVVFACTDAVMAALLEPLAALEVNHAADDETLQVVFEVTDTKVEVAETGADQEVGLIVSVGYPGCDTCTWAVAGGDPEVVCNVTVAERGDGVVFAAAVNVTAAFPVAPVEFNVNHVAEDEAVQLAFDETEIEVDAAATDGTDQDDGVGVTYGVPLPGCVTVTFAVATGLPNVVENVTVPVLINAPVLGVAVKVTTLFHPESVAPAFIWPNPDVGVTVSQEESEVAVQVIFDKALVVMEDPAAKGDHEMAAVGEDVDD